MGKSKQRTRSQQIKQRKRSKKLRAALMAMFIAGGPLTVKGVISDTFSHYGHYEVTVSG